MHLFAGDVGFLGSVPIVAGTVRFFGLPLEKVRGRVGYVPQRETVDWDFPVSVMDVVLMGTYGRLGWLRRSRPWASATATRSA